MPGQNCFAVGKGFYGQVGKECSWGFYTLGLDQMQISFTLKFFVEL